jgi:hypothetical protein
VGPLVASAAVAAALILLSRTKTAAAAWRYDPERRRYRAPGRVAGTALRAGALVEPPDVRRILDAVIDRAEPELLATAARLTNQRISLAGWYQQMEDMIATRYVMAATAARGGFAQMTPDDRAWVRDQIVVQFEALDGFAEDIRRGRYGNPPRGGQYEARVRQYAQAPRQAYEDMRGRVAEAAGFVYEQWFLGAADACRTKVRMGCIERARRGRVPINSVPGQGRCTCLHNCRCVRRLYRTAAGGRAA